jgi:hypothetical protein
MLMTGMPARSPSARPGSARHRPAAARRGVGLLRDRLLDLLGLRVGVGRLEQAELDVVVLSAACLRVLGDRAEPAVVGRRDARDDLDLLARPPSAGSSAAVR